MGRKIAAGMLSGSFAAAVCNPTDLVKTRMQTAGKRKGVLRIVRDVVETDGWRGFWRGTTPSMVCRLSGGVGCLIYEEGGGSVKRLFGNRAGLAVPQTPGDHPPMPDRRLALRCSLRASARRTTRSSCSSRGPWAGRTRSRRTLR